MSLALIGITVLWTFLFGYMIVASIDFGAGFLHVYSELSGNRQVIRGVVERYLSPVWEVTNVFLVFFFVGIVGFFPKTAYYYGSALLIPASISIILLAIRGSYYAFHAYGGGNRYYTLLYGLTGLFIPASLSIVFPISEGGFMAVKDDGADLLYGELLRSPYALSVVLLAITSILFISATFLTFYAKAADDKKAEQLLRRYALRWSLPTLLAALVTSYSLRLHNPEHFRRMTDSWWLFALSLLCFAGAVMLLYRRERYGLAFFLVVLQFGLAFFGYGFSHYPYLLYPYLTIDDGFTNQAMAKALMISFVLGLFALIPALYLLLRLFLFDPEYVKGKKKGGHGS
ncbi:cytochrome d ubiquinol oxidase subunit II [Thermicanus aegyptius]|uniref:cytochrome d ubiquinol oxidase subunit II n=1 Tax=Thermicanus aegyptius TaxID=94009 RepID=UPI0003FE0B8C|nr:cytochrome d ubiquinol oxidase subunit II [Thermicanus aegyptius]